VKVAIVHEWLETFAGSERVVEQLLACWPEADLFVVCDFLPESERGFLGGRRPRTTFIQRLPFARKRFRWYLGLMPLAIEQLDLSGYDLILSSSHAGQGDYLEAAHALRRASAELSAYGREFDAQQSEPS
jgi:hypothetical protein